MNIEPSIFKAYDVRGIVPEEINKEAAYRIGRAYINYLRNNPALAGPIQIVVSSDARASSPELKEELIRGITDEDAQATVIDVGLTTTPMHYFAINYLKAEGGVMVTASHNPKEYNGFKLSRGGAAPIYEGGGMEEIRNAAMRGVFETPKMYGKVEERDIADDYINFLLANVPANELKSAKVIFDCGNGMAGLLVRRLAERLPLTFEILYEDIDMTFPNHEANPDKEETLSLLKERIVATEADFGVAFDGDADRVAILDERGERIPGGALLGVLAKEALKEEPGAPIVHDARPSRALVEAIVAAGGKPIRARAGHSFVGAAMREKDAPLGGELTGHYFFRKSFYAESSLLAFLEFLRIFSRSGENASKLAAPFRVYPSRSLNMRVENRERAIDKITAVFRDGKADYLDGVSIEYPDVWFNVRVSNTEPLLRVMAEGRTEEAVKQATSKIREAVDI